MNLDPISEKGWGFSFYRRDNYYGCVFACVYFLDGTFLNAEILKQGYGFAYTKCPFKFLEEFRRNEREARENGRGLWRD